MRLKGPHQREVRIIEDVFDEMRNSGADHPEWFRKVKNDLGEEI